MNPQHAIWLIQAANAVQAAGSSAPEYIGEAILTLIVVANGLLNHRWGKTREKSLEKQFGEVNAGIAEVRAFVVGPDGENGLRGDVREIKESVKGLETRERERLERAAAPPRDFSLPSAPSRSPAQ